MSDKLRDDHPEDPHKPGFRTEGARHDCCTPPGPECDDPATCGPGCCAPPGSSHRTQWLIFLLVMAAAGGVLVYGILSREESVAQSSSANAGADAGGLARVEAGSTAGFDAAGEGGVLGLARGITQVSNATATDGNEGSARDVTFSWGGSDACIGGITQAASVIGMPEASDVLFVLLPGDDEQRILNARDVLNAAVQRIQEKGRAVAVRTLQRGQDGYAELVEQFAVSTFPCVIALGKACATEKVGEISEAHLIRAFVIASQPPFGCQAGSACCPSACGK